jgi:hypothetical protein
MIEIPRRSRMNPVAAAGAAGEACLDETLDAGAFGSVRLAVALLNGCRLAAVAAATPVAC